MKEAMLSLGFKEPKVILEKKIPFEGFTSEQEKKVNNQLKTIGLPLDNVTRVRYRPNQKGMENVLGSFKPYDGVFTLYKSLEKFSPIAQQGTMIHELTHALLILKTRSCMEEKNPLNSQEISFLRLRNKQILPACI